MAKTTIRTAAEARQTLRDDPEHLWGDDCEVLYNLAFIMCGGKTTTASATSANSKVGAAR
ncbi:hypothetical protein AB0J01_41405 [Streptomyces sp. NPDC050204]|uniref:hypothetical protein n=1 Tax=Streptomyces sp. NPDC050204 TaxID=3155514 RepID=UPI003428170B